MNYIKKKFYTKKKKSKINTDYQKNTVAQGCQTHFGLGATYSLIGYQAYLPINSKSMFFPLFSCKEVH